MRGADPTAGGMPPPLVETKFAQPRERPGSVKRARLQSALGAFDGAAFTLLAAPTGYGKTTVVRAWCGSGQRRVAWVTLDEGDNDPVRLWTYVATAIDRIRGGLGRLALQRLRTPGVSLELAIDELVNAMASFSSPMAIVLDDLQTVVDSDCMASIEYAVERLPPNARILAITRIDPAMRLARLRARGALAELRAVDLAFTVTEARELLVERESIAVSDEDVAALVQHTEGWPAGLYLAALWLRGLDDPSAGVREFAGLRREVAEYLASEVLDALDADVRSFLMRSAVIGRFTAELCDAVLDRDDSASMLAELERSNLFLVPLEGQGGWFRYHALFSELLRIELEKNDPAEEIQIHRRASAWYRERGLVVESAEHASAGRDHHVVAELLAENHLILVRSGLSATFLRSIGTLPEEQLLEFPILPVIAAYAAGMTGRPAVERRHFLALGERAKAEHPERLVPYHEAATEMTRASWIDGDVGEALHHGRRAVALAASGTELYVAARSSLAVLLYFAGELDDALEMAQSVVRHHDAVRATVGHIEARSILALVATEQDRLAVARRDATAAKTIARQNGLEESWVGAHASAAEAVVLAAEGRLSEAEREAESAERTRRGLEASVEHTWTLIVLASIRVRRGRLSPAERALDEARALLVELSNPGRLPALAAEAEASLAQARANAEEAPLIEPLTPSELEILRLLGTDFTQREIGRQLYLSVNTIKTHTRSLYRKLGVSTREDANVRAAMLGILDIPQTPPSS